MKRTLLVAFALLTVGELAQAQIIQPIRRNRPMAFASLGVGWMQQEAICDSDSGACWNFGGVPQYRGTLELPVGQGLTAGIAATTARAPLVWAANSPAPNQCPQSQCDADVNVTQVFGNLRLGGEGRGFQQVVDLVVGTTMFSNFRATDGTKLGPGKTVSDVTFGIGVGFGYGFSSRAQFVITQEWDIVLHKRLPGSPSNSARQQAIRVGLRMGLGDR